MGCQNGEAVGLPRCWDCIFMQGVSGWSAVCKLLFYSGLGVAFQKFNFQRAKVELLGGESSTVIFIQCFFMFMQVCRWGFTYGVKRISPPLP